MTSRSNRPTPVVPPDHVPRHDPRRELDGPALKAAGVRLPAPPRVPVIPGAKAQERAPSSDAALQLKVRDPRGWAEFVKSTATVVTAVAGLAGVIVGGGKVKEALDRLEVQAARISALIAQTEEASAKHAQAITKAEARIRELDCQVGVLASIAKRQGFETGFDDDVSWLSARLEQANKPKSGPLWITRKTCVALPLTP